MKLTKKNIQQVKDDSNSAIMCYVCDYVLDNYSNYEDKKNIFGDVLNYGCQSGIVGSLIYYRDTVAFYEEHKEEINSLLYEMMSECGLYDPCELFGNKWDDEDPLCLEDFNKNLLAWFAFEETMRKLARQFEDLEDLF